MLLTPQNNVNNTVDNDGLFASQKATAINIALSDPTIKSKLLYHPGNSIIGNVTLSRIDEESGYANSADTIVNVPFRFWGLQLEENEKMTIYVDLNTSKVMGSIWYSYRGFPRFAEITIPPGVYWYDKIVGGMISSDGGSVTGEDTLELSPDVFNIGPDNESIYPTIVDRENLNLFLNNSPYQALIYHDNINNKTSSTKGDIAYSNSWSTQIVASVPPSVNGSSWPSYNVPDIFLLLRNGYTDRNVVVSLY